MNTTSNITRKEKLAEAINRMKIIGISEDMQNHLSNGDGVPVYFTNLDNASAFVNPLPESYIRKFEKRFNALVYCVITTDTSLGNMESLLFVSDYKEEWEDDRADLLDGYVMTWTENLTYPACSEFGSIAFEKQDSGALWRIS